MTQPPLSARIKDLERELGFVLFERSARGVILTDAGDKLLPLAQQAIDSLDLVLRSANAIGRTNRDPIRVAVTPDTTSEAIELFTRLAKSAKPSIHLEVIEASTAQQLDRLRNGEVDLGLLRHPFPSKGLVMGPLLSTPVGALMAADHPLASHAVIHPHELLPYPLVAFPREAAPGNYDETLAALTTHGLESAELRFAVRIVHSLLVTENAVALRNSGHLFRHSEDLVWRPIGDNFLTWHTSVAWSLAAKHPAIPICANLLTQALLERDQWTGPSTDDESLSDSA